MAFTFITSAKSSAPVWTAATSRSASSLNILAGDIIVAYVVWFGGSSTVTVGDGETNSCTMESTVDYGGNEYVTAGYILSANADATSTFSCSLGTARNYLYMHVAQFRNTGSTVSKDQSQASGNGFSTTPATGNITTTGTDELVVACLHVDIGYGGDPGSPTIGGTAATLISGDVVGPIQYRILTGIMTNGNAAGSYIGNASWAAVLNSFKGEGAGSASTTYTHRTMVFG